MVFAQDGGKFSQCGCLCKYPAFLRGLLLYDISFIKAGNIRIISIFKKAMAEACDSSMACKK